MSTSKYQIILEFLTVAVGAYVPSVYKVIFKAEKRPLFQTKYEFPSRRLRDWGYKKGHNKAKLRLWR